MSPKSSVTSKRLRNKLVIMYALMTVIPVLFLLYIIIQPLSPKLGLPALPDWTSGQAGLPGSMGISLIIGLAAIGLMSLAGFLLMYRSIHSIEKITKKTEDFLVQTKGPDMKLAMTDEVEKMGRYFTDLLVELQNKITQANQYAQDLAESNRKLAQLALKDGLTNLYNQTYIKERLSQELERASRFNHTLGLLMIDIDDFKVYNDNYGHLAGDTALKEVADIITRCIREEVFRHIFATPLSGTTERITISIGISSYLGDGKVIGDLINQADHALYEAKRKGKNLVAL